MGKSDLLAYLVIGLLIWLVIAGAFKTVELVLGMFKKFKTQSEMAVDDMEDMILSVDEIGDAFCKRNGFDGGYLMLKFYTKRSVVIHCYGIERPYGPSTKAEMLSKDFGLSEVLDAKRSWE